MTALLDAIDEASALDDLHRLGCTDGLPVVIPTPARVDAMVLASGLDGDLVLGTMGPAGGVASVRLVATAAVMAGCTPEHIAVVVAAVRAVADERFDLAEMQATTHCTAPLIIVNGPARQACGGISGGYGALGPGLRANASIGRALRLAMINIGGGRTGSSDMALLGHPGKFAYCFGEDEENSPFTPLHVHLGHDPIDSAVTVVGAGAPQSVMVLTDADDPGSADRILDALSSALTSIGSNNAILGGGTAIVLINPGHAETLAGAGHDRNSIAEQITARAVNDAQTMAKAFRGLDPNTDTTYPCLSDPADLIVAVAGGAGVYSAVMDTWVLGPHRNAPVTVGIELDQSCEIPWADQG